MRWWRKAMDQCNFSNLLVTEYEKRITYESQLWKCGIYQNLAIKTLPEGISESKFPVQLDFLTQKLYNHTATNQRVVFSAVQFLHKALSKIKRFPVRNGRFWQEWSTIHFISYQKFVTSFWLGRLNITNVIFTIVPLEYYLRFQDLLQLTLFSVGWI